MSRPSVQSLDAGAMIYFIQAGGFVKIGKTTASNLAKRCSQIQNGCPERAHIVVTLDSPPFDEETIHRKLSKSHYRGEWFRLTDEVRSFVDKALVLDRRRMRDVQKKMAGWFPLPVTTLAVLPDTNSTERAA